MKNCGISKFASPKKIKPQKESFEAVRKSGNNVSCKIHHSHIFKIERKEAIHGWKRE
jgi:hypothetical protein